MNLRIKCNTMGEMNHVLSKLEKRGYTWLSGDKPTQKNYFNEYNNYVYAWDDKTLCTYDRFGGTKEVSAAEFLRGDRYKPIMISVKGNEVVAEDKNTGKVGIAKCSPDDTFDFELGARIAFGRLMGDDVRHLYDDEYSDVVGEDEEAEDVIRYKEGDVVRIRDGLVVHRSYNGITYLDGMDLYKGLRFKATNTINKFCLDDNKCSDHWYFSDKMIEPFTYKVGDRIQIREWDDMLEEFGENDCGSSIACAFSFSDSMKYLCGAVGTIKGVRDKSVHITFDNDAYNDTWCVYSTDMIKPLVSQEFNTGDVVKVISDDGDDVVCEVGGIDSSKTFHSITFYNCGDNTIDSRKLKLVCKNTDIIRVCDTIKVIDSGEAYSTYQTWVDQHVFGKYDKYRFDYNHSPKNGMIGRVLAVGKHDDSDDTLVYFEDIEDDRCYLISHLGVEVVKEND